MQQRSHIQNIHILGSLPTLLTLCFMHPYYHINWKFLHKCNYYVSRWFVVRCFNKLLALQLNCFRVFGFQICLTLKILLCVGVNDPLCRRLRRV